MQLICLHDQCPVKVISSSESMLNFYRVNPLQLTDIQIIILIKSVNVYVICS